jgi:23S rRNA pseudouridine1911/1915/1917 synthase
VAKNDQTLQYLQAQFSSRKVEKVYFALVEGILKSSVGRIEAEIGRSKRDRKRMAVFPDGKAREAITFYRVIEEFDRHSYLEAKPETGRTHQIRLHLAFIGCPIVGDRVYGRKKSSLKLNRHFLHAGMLRIRIPGETEIKTFEAALPEDLSSVLESLQK